MAKHPVNVVHIPVLPATIVLAIFMHGGLWTVEDTRLEREREGGREERGVRERRREGGRREGRGRER